MTLVVFSFLDRESVGQGLIFLAVLNTGPALVLKICFWDDFSEGEKID